MCAIQKSARKLGCTVLDSAQSVLRVMTIQEHRRHPQGMLFKDIIKDMILDSIWIRQDTPENTQLLLEQSHGSAGSRGHNIECPCAEEGPGECRMLVHFILYTPTGEIIHNAVSNKSILKL